MQSSESEVIAQRPPRQEMDAPVFVEVMRAPLPGVSTGPALAPTTGMRGTVSTSAAGADTYRVEVGSSATAVDVAENSGPTTRPKRIEEPQDKLQARLGWLTFWIR